MKNIIALLSIIICIVFFSCSGHKKNSGKEEQPPEKGKIINKVKCKKNVIHSYALYLPSTYSEEKKYSVIICFDPHGNGTKPLELMKDDAEKLGYILIGSNVSKNGMQWDAASAHYDVLLTDISERFDVDSTRIYTCGFSGGSRIASTIAILKGGIAGVIGCSGGFPQLKEAIKTKFDFLGIAGNDDMNYAEMANLDLALEKNNLRHQLIVFNGTHEWPPKEVIPEAFLWLELNAMKDKKKLEDKDFIKRNLSDFELQLSTLKKKGNKYDEYLLTKKIVNYFKELADIKTYEEQLSKLEATPAVKNGLAQALLNMKKELGMQQNLGQKLSTENPAWWRNEVFRLNDFLKRSPNADEKHIVKRSLEYMSLAAFSASTSLYNQNKFAEAANYIEIYSIIDTDNPEPEFMFAQIYARKKDAGKALEHLKKAAELGFAERSRIDNDTIFLKLNSDKRFTEIMDAIAKNQNKKL